MTEPVRVLGAILQLVGLALTGYAYVRKGGSERAPYRSLRAWFRATPDERSKLSTWYRTATFRIHLAGWLLFGAGLVLFYLPPLIRGDSAP